MDISGYRESCILSELESIRDSYSRIDPKYGVFDDVLKLIAEYQQELEDSQEQVESLSYERQDLEDRICYLEDEHNELMQELDERISSLTMDNETLAEALNGFERELEMLQDQRDRED